MWLWLCPDPEKSLNRTNSGVPFMIASWVGIYECIYLYIHIYVCVLLVCTYHNACLYVYFCLIQCCLLTRGGLGFNEQIYQQRANLSSEGTSKAPNTAALIAPEGTPPLQPLGLHRDHQWWVAHTQHLGQHDESLMSIHSELVCVHHRDLFFHYL